MANTPPVRSAEGVPIHYEVAGDGEPAVVLVHGWAFDHHLWDAFVPRLAARHRVVTLDLPGHGASGAGRSRWTMDAFGEDVAAVVDAAGAHDVVLIGHSMGGVVVLEAARRLRGRVRGIVLVDMILDAEERMPPEQIDAVATQLQADYRAVVSAMSNEHLLTESTPPAVREQVLRRVRDMDQGVSIALLRETWGYDPRPALGEIRAPIRAVSADKFPTRVETNRRYMPGYEATVVPGTGHYLMLEQPEAFAKALGAALHQVLAAATR